MGTNTTNPEGGKIDSFVKECVMRNGKPKDRKVQTFMKKEALFVVLYYAG